MIFRVSPDGMAYVIHGNGLREEPLGHIGRLLNPNLYDGRTSMAQMLRIQLGFEQTSGQFAGSFQWQRPAPLPEKEKKPRASKKASHSR